MKNRPPFNQAFTFDDVLLVPKQSNILPKDVKLKTRLTRKISMNIPLISAAMDTVTESDMAVALARQGGIGIIHKNLSIDAQALMVDRVKRSESGMISNPVTLSSEKTIRDAKEVMSNYHISGLPVVENDKLIGIITNRDIRFETDDNLSVKDRMTTNELVTVIEGTTLEDAKKVLQKHRIEKLLVVNENGSLVGLITVKDIQKKEDFPNACKDENGRLRVGAAIGVGNDSIDRAKAGSGADVDVIVIGAAGGRGSGVLKSIKNIKKAIGDLQVIAGNVATLDGTKALIDIGVDCVKVGIREGASCTTRVVAGVGMAQMSGIMI